MPSIPEEYRLSRPERRAFAVVAVLLLAVLVLPYLWVAAITPYGYVYGGLLYNPDDQNVHLAWARQAAEGHFAFRDLFTTENLVNAERPLFTNLFCWVIGVVSALTQAPAIWIYHLLRVVFAVLALWWFYSLSALLTTDKRTRLLALLLAAFSGGAGWLQAVMPGRIFIDRPDNAHHPMMPEAFTFTSAFVFPLYIASMALLIAVFHQVELARRTQTWKPALCAAAAALLLANIHTYDVIPLNIVLLVWAAASLLARSGGSRPRMTWLAPVVAVAGTLPPLAWQLYVFTNSSEFKIKALTKTSAPPLFDIVLSYGPLLLLALTGGLVVWREGRGRLMLLWMTVTFACIYAPVSFARKMIEGLHLPMCFLAAAGLVWLLARAPGGPAVRRGLAAVAVLVLSLSSFRFVGWCLENARDNNMARAGVFMPPLYLTESDYKALRYLDSTTRRDTAVLALPFLGNYVPRETGRNVYVGHWAETLNFFDADSRTGKIVEAQRFYGLTRPMTDAEALRWLRENRIGFVVMGFYEKRFGARLPLELRRVHSEGDTEVYEVPSAGSLSE